MGDESDEASACPGVSKDSSTIPHTYELTQFWRVRQAFPEHSISDSGVTTGYWSSFFLNPNCVYTSGPASSKSKDYGFFKMTLIGKNSAPEERYITSRSSSHSLPL